MGCRFWNRGGLALYYYPRFIFANAGKIIEMGSILQDQQTYAMTRSPLRGMGLSLSLSRAVVLLGGRLEWHHRPAADDVLRNAGMTATIVLPNEL
jgi:hypothetical protein